MNKKIKKRSFKIIIFLIISMMNFNLLKSEEINPLKYKDINEFHKSDRYLIGPGDLLKVKFIGYEELSDEFEVMQDGNVNLPLINLVYLKNLSIIDAQNKLRDSYKDQLVSTEIFLSVKKSKAISISVFGEVNKPGIFHFNIEANNFDIDSNDSEFPKNFLATNPRVIDAIRIAEGITESADTENIILRRKISSNKTTSYKEVRLNLLNLYKNGDELNNPVLLDGDIIKIEKNDKNSILNENFVNSNIMKNSIKVSIVGEVKFPGIINLDSRTTISEAIFNAGGPINFSANTQDIELVRRNKDGKIFIDNFKLNLSNINSEKNPILQNGDIVIIKERKISKGLDTLDKITRPFSGIANTINIFRILN